MLKKYKQFNESLLNKLEGPTKEEVINKFKNNPAHLLTIAYDNGLEDEDIIKDIIDKYVSNEILLDSKVTLNSALVTFCRHGLPYGIKKILDMGADINFGNGEPLYYAIGFEKPNAVDFLLKNGADIHSEWSLRKAFDIYNVEPSYKILEILLENGAKCPSNFEPLRNLINNDTETNLSFFKLFVKYGEKITSELLYSTALNRNINILNYILEKVDSDMIPDKLINEITWVISIGEYVEKNTMILDLLKKKKGIY